VRTLEKPAFWRPFNPDRLHLRRRLSPAGYAFLVTKAFDIDPTVTDDEVNVIVYPEYAERHSKNDIHELIDYDGFAVTRHIGRVSLANPDSLFAMKGVTTCSHVFVWRDGMHVMTDVWNSSFSIDDGYQIATIEVFRDLEQVDPAKYGHTGRNVMYVMGKETEYITDRIDEGEALHEACERDLEHMPEFPGKFIAHARYQRR
jgi:hypothetical protein